MNCPRPPSLRISQVVGPTSVGTDGNRPSLFCGQRRGEQTEGEEEDEPGCSEPHGGLLLSPVGLSRRTVPCQRLSTRSAGTPRQQASSTNWPLSPDRARSRRVRTWSGSVRAACISRMGCMASRTARAMPAVYSAVATVLASVLEKSPSETPGRAMFRRSDRIASAPHKR